MPENPELTVVIPTYNERRRIMRTLDAYTRFFDESGISYEVIVADYSKDGSKELIREYVNDHPRVRLLDIGGRGKGLAVYEGFKAGRGDFLSFTDADNATSPEEFLRVFRSIAGYDAAIGSRNHEDSSVVNHHQTLFRRLGGLVLDVFFVRMLFGLRFSDTQCGAKVFRSDKLLRVLPSMRIMNSIFDVELLWRFSKAGTVVEVPISWVDDRFSHFKWSDTFAEAVSLLETRLRG